MLKIKKKHLPRILLFLSLSFGLIFSFLIPPFILADEENNFVHAESIASGYSVLPLSDNGEVTVPSYVALMLEIKKAPINNYNKYFYFNGSHISGDETSTKTLKTAPAQNMIFLITPIVSSLILKMFIALGVPVSVLGVLIFGRILNVLVFSILCYQFFSRTFFSRDYVFLFLLSPMVIMLSATLSSIPLAVLSTIFFIYQIITTFGSEKIQKKNFLLSWSKRKVITLSVITGLFLPILTIPIILVFFFSKKMKYNIKLFVLLATTVSILQFILFVPDSLNLSPIFNYLPDSSDQFFWLLNDIFVDQNLLSLFPNPLIHILMILLFVLFISKENIAITHNRIIGSLKQRVLLWIFSASVLFYTIYVFSKRTEIAFNMFNSLNIYLLYPTVLGLLFFCFACSRFPVIEIQNGLKNIFVSFLSLLLLTSTLLSIIINLYF